MFKKLIILSLIINILLINIVLADDKVEEVNVKEMKNIIQTVSQVADEPKINSRYAVVIDRNSKAILYGKNEKTKTKMASTTNIMTS